jgi:hypothetical protein
MTEKLYGTVRDNLGDSFTTVEAESRTDKYRPFFIEKHNAPVNLPLLVVLEDDPFLLRITSSGPRGFVAELGTGALQPKSGGVVRQVVASAHNFDPSKLGGHGEVLLDRWQEDGRALAIGSKQAALRDGVLASDEVRKTMTLLVSPLLKLEAGGVEWTASSPVLSENEFKDLAEALSSIAPGQVIKGASSEELRRLLNEVSELARQLRETDDIFSSGGRGAFNLEKVLPGEHVAAAGTGGTGVLGHLIHGEPLGKQSGGLTINPTEMGTATPFPIAFLVCTTIEKLAQFRTLQPNGQSS